MGKGVHLDAARRTINVAVGLVATLGFALLIEGPTKIISHDYTVPSYVHHHHHLCHVLTIALALASWWWFLLLVLIARNRDARQSAWAQRLLGVPVLVLSVVGALTAWYVWVTIQSHDEVTYAGVMGVANGALLLVIALNCFSLSQNALREEKGYAWNYLALSWVFLAALAGLFSANAVWLAAALSGAATALLAAGLWRAKFTIVQKTL